MRNESLLLSVGGTAEFLNVSERMFHQLRHRPDFPQPISLGQRALRWRRADIALWVESQPAASPTPEPAQMRLERDARRAAADAAGGAR